MKKSHYQLFATNKSVSSLQREIRVYEFCGFGTQRKCCIVFIFLYELKLYVSLVLSSLMPLRIKHSCFIMSNVFEIKKIRVLGKRKEKTCIRGISIQANIKNLICTQKVKFVFKIQ